MKDITLKKEVFNALFYKDKLDRALQFYNKINLKILDRICNFLLKYCIEMERISLGFIAVSN